MYQWKHMSLSWICYQNWNYLNYHLKVNVDEIQSNHQNQQKMMVKNGIQTWCHSRIPGSPFFLHCSQHGKTNKEHVIRKRGLEQNADFLVPKSLQSSQFTSAARWNSSTYSWPTLSDSQNGSLNSSSFLAFQTQDNSSLLKNKRSWSL